MNRTTCSTPDIRLRCSGSGTSTAGPPTSTFNPLPPYGTYDPKRRNIYLARMTDDELRAYHAVVDPQNADGVTQASEAIDTS